MPQLYLAGTLCAVWLRLLDGLVIARVYSGVLIMICKGQLFIKVLDACLLLSHGCRGRCLEVRSLAPCGCVPRVGTYNSTSRL